MAESLIPSGNQSRKYKLTLYGLGLITGFSLLTLNYPALVGLFPTFIGGIIGTLGLYFTGNVSQKILLTKKTNQGEEG